MGINKPKNLDTSTAWHDYTVTEVIARHFWVGETTGYEAVANAWAQIAKGKIDELGLSVGFTEGVGFLHALNTFGKNIHINGYGHKTNGGRKSYVDYRLLGQYNAHSHNSFLENGYAVSLNAAPLEAISDYKSKYANEIISAIGSEESYLKSLQEYLVSDSIVSILCGDFMEGLASSLGVAYGLERVEGIMLPPQSTQWEIQAPWCNEKVTAPSAIVVMAAIEDHHPISGVLQIVAGSHKLELDPNIIKDWAIAQNHDKYTEHWHKLATYYHGLASMDDKKIYQHMPAMGDVVAWQGKSIYSSAIPSREKRLTRNSLIGVFKKVNAKENKDSLIPIPDKNMLFLIG